MKTDSLTITRPDDWHLHLRDGAALAAVLPHTARQFARAVVMPNLSPPVVRLADARAYQARIEAALPPGAAFQPLMTLYLTEATPPEALIEAAESGAVVGVKLYPAGATTNSDSGVREVSAVLPQLEVMAAAGLPLLVHGEVTDPAVDIFDREAVFLERTLGPLLERLPTLRVVLEHITTAAAVRFVDAAGPQLGATITAHHLLATRNDMLVGAIRPHYFCLPVLKREEHRLALLEAATGGSPKFFLGTDSAPHARAAKETACGCAGIFSAPAAIELYATAFEQAGALDRLEGFAGRHGPIFYDLPFNRGTLTLVRRPNPVPAVVAAGEAGDLVPLGAGTTLDWSVLHPAAGHPLQG
jgi:dihydroorotase